MPQTGQLRLFPLNTVLFPGAVLNLHVFEERYRRMIAECLDAHEAFGVVLIREGGEAGDPDVTPHEIGTTAEISEVTPLPAGRYYVSTTGKRRFRIDRIVSREPYLLAASYVVGDALQVADNLKQRLLELRTAEARLAAELGFLRRLLPQLRSLLERKESHRDVVRDDAPGGEFRAHQERYFGKHFSSN